MPLCVGVFDSGAGGLTVLRACRRRLPFVRFLYFGDNARAPYGSRPREEIAAFTREAFQNFRALGADAAVLACNTASAVCLGDMRREFSFPVLGIEPAVLPAARSGAKKILVLCTPRTAESERLGALVARCRRAEIAVHPCPRLAAAVEAMLLRGEPLSLAEHLPKGEFGGVVLGCTHYSFLAKEIAAFYGAPVFDGAEGVAARLQKVLCGMREEGTSAPPAWAEVDGKNKSLRLLWSSEPEINKSSPSKWLPEGEDGVIFMGASAEINRKIYKQMF